MTEAVLPNTPSRRAVFAGAGALLAGAAATAIATAPPACTDAQLIALCDEFCALERAWLAQINAGLEDKDIDDEHRQARQEEIAAFVETNPPQTWEGFKAVAYAATLWAPDMFGEPHITVGETLGGLMAGLFRGLLGGVKP